MKVFFLALLYSYVYTASGQSGHNAVPVESGVSKALAVYRQSIISNIYYDISFHIPAEKDSAVLVEEIIKFDVRNVAEPLQLDWKSPTGIIQSLVVNGQRVEVNLQQEHLLIDGKDLQTGSNQIAVVFTAGNTSLNRNTDYLYALFVPDHARTVFPCFDQPDLKARFLLTLEVPVGWKVLANATIVDSLVNVAHVVYHFAPSDKLSTYLFSFTAGKYNSTVKELNNRNATFSYRETDTTKLKLSIDSIFRIHQEAISFLEQYTGIPFPFQKVGFVAIPDFQFGGMEHPGEVQYKASSLFLDSGATKDQLIARINLISHETAHMWFGDLVTMRWFNDVWMKEVFANFMADKVAEKLMGMETFNLKFLQDHYPAAYSIDRTNGTHPIRQQLDNLQDAGSLYGNIIYHKAPIMMRQLEGLMGKDNFRAGLQEYLKTYAYGNADWPELIRILSEHTTADLYQWNEVWVNEPGRPIFSFDATYLRDTITRFRLHQKAERGDKRVWPQRFAITLIYPDHQQVLSVNMTDEMLDLKEAVGLSKPTYILFNSDGMGYGVFPVDKTMLPLLSDQKNPLKRAAAYINLYENTLSGQSLYPVELLNLFASGLTTEQNELNLRLLTGYIGNLYWTFLSPAERHASAVKLEDVLWKTLLKQQIANNKKILFKAYQDIAETSSANTRLYGIWQQQKPPTGITLTEEDYTSLALTIALKNDTAISVLPQQQARIKNEDRKKRLAFIGPAVSPDSATRGRFFASLKERRNREKEAWVVAALSYLHHPLRQSTSLKYLPESLNMLAEIKETGDIFFPQNWLGSTLNNYQSSVAAKMVRAFLQQHPKYDPKLKGKVLQAADNLFRAETLLKR